MVNRCVSYAYFRNPNSVYEKEKGNSAKQFEQFLPLLIRAHHLIWGGFDLLIHHDEEVKSLPYWPALDRMVGAGLLKLVPCGNAERLCEAMLWRLKPVWAGYDVVVCRDIDAIPAPFDRRIVDEWLDSRKAVGVVHWCAAHSGVMGGTLSVRSKRFAELLGYASWGSFILDNFWCSLKAHGDDQHVLNRLFPRFARETLVHDLHHKTGDMPGAEIRTRIRDGYTDPALLASFDHGVADQLSKGCGVCWDPKEALEFYDRIQNPVMDKIRECERG